MTVTIRGTTIYYGEGEDAVTIYNVHTKTFSQQAVMDESDTDLMYQKFLIKFVGYVHRNTVTSQTVNISTNNLLSVAQGEIDLRLQLMQPRKMFKMTLGAVPLLWVFPSQGNGQIPNPDGINQRRVGQMPGQLQPYAPRDVNNGPKPRSCDITHIAGTETLKVEMEIEVCVVECANSTNNSGVLSNRWFMRDVVDRNAYTTRTIQGRMRVASPNINPMGMRNWIVPQLQNGFIRDSVEVAVTPDGLTLDYSIVDSEFYVAPPQPATKWEATHTRTTQDGAKFSDEMSIRLEGPKNCEKKDLIITMMRVVDQYLSFNTALHLEQCAIIDHVDSNVVEARVAVQRAIDKENASAGAIGKFMVFGFGETPKFKLVGNNNTVDYDKDVAALPLPTGTGDAAWQLACYLQSPCDATHFMKPFQAAERDTKSPIGRNTSVDVFKYSDNKKIPTDPTIKSNYNNDVSANNTLYSFYSITMTQDETAHVIQCPIARQFSNTGGAFSDATALFVRMAPNTCKKRFHVLARRIGAWPRLPRPLDHTIGGIQYRLCGQGTLRADASKITANGSSRMYEAEMSIPYAMSRPQHGSEVILVGALPWDSIHTLAAAAAINPQAVFVRGLTDDANKP